MPSPSIESASVGGYRSPEDRFTDRFEFPINAFSDRFGLRIDSYIGFDAFARSGCLSVGDDAEQRKSQSDACIWQAAFGQQQSVVGISAPTGFLAQQEYVFLSLHLSGEKGCRGERGS